MLKIILGRISTGKTEKIINRIGERINSGLPSVLIVPDPVTYNFEQRMCSQLKINGFIDAEVCSFNRFASNIISFCGKGRKTYLDDCMRMMFLRRCINDCTDSFTLFKNASKRKGFTKRCLNMISTLENCGYSPENISKVASELPDGVLKYKLADTALIYEKYAEILSSGYTDNSDSLLCAQALLPEYTPLDGCTVFIDGFDVFTSRLYSFIAAIMNRCDVVIALSSSCGGKDRDAYEIHEITLKKLVAAAKENNIDIKYEFTNQTQREKSPEIIFTENNYYSLSPDVFDKKCDNLSLTHYVSPEDEVYSVAVKIACEVRSGLRYKDIAVLCGDVNKYSSIVSSVFSRFSIPVYTDEKHDISSHPVALYLFSLLKCVTYGFTPSAIEDILLSSLSPLDRDECDRFITFMRETGIKGSELEYGVVSAVSDAEKLADFNILHQKLIPPIKELKTKLLNAKTSREMSEICYSFMQDGGVFEKLDILVDKYENMGEYRFSDITSQLWNTAVKLLEDAAVIFENRKISVADFADALREGFDSSPVSTIPSVLDCVTFGALDSAREQNILHTYIIGANEGVIPAVYSDERLVTAKESEILTDYNLELAHSVGTEDARIRYSMYSAFSSPKQKLDISCPLNSSSGSTLAPSYIFGRFTKLFPEITIETPLPLTPAEMLSNPLSKEELILTVAKDRVNSQQSRALFEFFKEDSEFDTVKFLSNHLCENLDTDTAKKLFSSAISLSRLEKYAACPLAHFIQSGLRPKELKDFTFDDRDRGNVFHSTLERFVKNRSNISSREECNALVSKIFDEESEKVHFGAMVASGRQRAFNKILKNIISACAWKINTQLYDFDTIGTEILFGYGSIPPLEIKTDYGTLLLKGKIDRADKKEQDGKIYLRIVDYKSYNETFKTDNIEKGLQLQLMMYMNVLISRYGKNASPAEAFYMHISEGNTSTPEKMQGLSSNNFGQDGKISKSVSEEEFFELLNTAMRVSQKLSSDMLSGKISAECSDDSCKYCNFAPICGKTVKEDTKDEQS